MKRVWVLAILGAATVGFAVTFLLPTHTTVEYRMSSGEESLPNEAQHQATQTSFLDGFFIIGVFSQPADSFAKWKSRGINTILEVPMNNDAAAWDKAAQGLGLKVIRRPLPDAKSDIGRKDLLAWSHWDEPDASGHIAQWAPAIEKTYAEWRALDPNRKIFVNFAGPDITWFTNLTDAYSKEHSSYYPRLIKCADWVAADIYPCGGWLNNAHKLRRGDITLIAEPIKAIRKLTDKPVFAFIETSEVERGNVEGARCPTADEVRAEIWEAVIHGARGIFYFPAVVGKSGFQYDGTPPAIAQEITRQNGTLRQLSQILQTDVNPSRFTATVEKPLESGWRVSGGVVHYFILNTSSQKLNSAKIQLTGVDEKGVLTVVNESRTVPLSKSAFTDTFEPYAIHIYTIEAPKDVSINP